MGKSGGVQKGGVLNRKGRRRGQEGGELKRTKGPKEGTNGKG